MGGNQSQRPASSVSSQKVMVVIRESSRSDLHRKHCDTLGNGYWAGGKLCVSGKIEDLDKLKKEARRALKLDEEKIYRRVNIFDEAGRELETEAAWKFKSNKLACEPFIGDPNLVALVLAYLGLSPFSLATGSKLYLRVGSTPSPSFTRLLGSGKFTIAVLADLGDRADMARFSNGIRCIDGHSVLLNFVHPDIEDFQEEAKVGIDGYLVLVRSDELHPGETVCELLDRMLSYYPPWDPSPPFVVGAPVNPDRHHEQTACRQANENVLRQGKYKINSPPFFLNPKGKSSGVGTRAEAAPFVAFNQNTGELLVAHLVRLLIERRTEVSYPQSRLQREMSESPRKIRRQRRNRKRRQQQQLERAQSA